MELESRDARSASSSGEFYTWKFPGAPLRIRISLNCVERLGNAVNSAAKPENGAGTETGGLLIGKVASTACDVEVSDFEPLSCDLSPEGRFAISTPAHVEMLEQAISAERNGVAVVGFYRSHLRDGLCLDDRDVTVGRIWFSNPSNVFLVIKPSAMGSCDAGFFFWDGDQIQSAFSFMEFPFEASLLRRITALESVPDASEPKPPAADAPHPMQAEPASDRQPKASSSVLFWMLTATLLLLAGAIGAGLFLYLHGALGGARESAAGQDTTLGLRAENRGGDLAITWDRNSPAVRSGRSGSLAIWDGDQPKQEIPLDTSQLRSASVLYAPQTDRVQFRLEVDGDSKASESVLAILRGRAPPAAESAGLPAQPLRPQGVPSASQAEAPAANAVAPSLRSVEPEPRPAARQVRAFIPPPQQARPDVPVRTLYLDPPAVSGPSAFSASPRLTSLEPERLTAPPPAAAPPPAEVKPVPAAPERAPEPKRRDVTYIPPRPLRQVPPSVPNQLLRTLISGDTRVEVAVQVDASGRVTDARVVTGTAHRLLVNAISEAAKKWNFDPARLDGKPVAGEARIVFLLRDPRGVAGR